MIHVYVAPFWFCFLNFIPVTGPGYRAHIGPQPTKRNAGSGFQARAMLAGMSALTTAAQLLSTPAQPLLTSCFRRQVLVFTCSYTSHMICNKKGTGKK